MSELDSVDTELLAKKLGNIIRFQNIEVGANLPKVAFDQGHMQAWSTSLEEARVINPTHPDDSSYAQVYEMLKGKGFSVINLKTEITQELIAGVDVLILPHNALGEYERVILAHSPLYSESEIGVIEKFVLEGGGLLVLSEHEINKYGNNISELLEGFEITLKNNSVQDNVSNHNGVAFWPRVKVSKPNAGITARVKEAAVYRSGSFVTNKDLQEILVSNDTSDPANQGIMVGKPVGEGYIIVSADSDLFGDDSVNDYDHRELFYNLVTFLGSQKKKNGFTKPLLLAGWVELSQSIESLKKLQEKDGSVIESEKQAQAFKLVTEIKGAIRILEPNFPADKLYLAEVISDLDKWVAASYTKPDFYQSLAIFRPELQRIDGLQHLVVFPMYTQNGNANINFEALIITTYWPNWLAVMEANGYDNKGFLTIMLEFATSGYDNHCATLFPETVSTSQEVKYTWGAIFADRESARFRKVAQEAAMITKLDLPADVMMLLNDAVLAQEVFALWDLIHDRTHMHGDLPFDPFMIKQRSPYWMYALEELRCDLNSYKEASELYNNGFAHGRLIMYAVLFDRIFRFPVTGSRVRNYDGLGGQILFSHLHKTKVINWRDNILTIDWLTLDSEIESLRVEIEKLYREGINSPKLTYWQNAYRLVNSIVQVSPASKWQNQNFDYARTNKEILDDILDDEFPLSLFHEALSKKIAPVIQKCSGITGRE